MHPDAVILCSAMVDHKYAYDEETLILVLQNAGFSKVIQHSCGISLYLGMASDREDRSSESLHVEAVKRWPRSLRKTSTRSDC